MCSTGMRNSVVARACRTGAARPARTPGARRARERRGGGRLGLNVEQRLRRGCGRGAGAGAGGRRRRGAGVAAGRRRRPTLLPPGDARARRPGPAGLVLRGALFGLVAGGVQREDDGRDDEREPARQHVHRDLAVASSLLDEVARRRRRRRRPRWRRPRRPSRAARRRAPRRSSTTSAPEQRAPGDALAVGRHFVGARFARRGHEGDGGGEAAVASTAERWCLLGGGALGSA